MNINHAAISGNLTRDPDIYYPENGGSRVVTMTVASNRVHPDGNGGWVDEPLYIKVTAFGKLAESLVDEEKGGLRTGDYVVVSGRMKGSLYEDSSGNKRYGIKIVAYTVEVKRKKREEAKRDRETVDDGIEFEEIASGYFEGTDHSKKEGQEEGPPAGDLTNAADLDEEKLPEQVADAGPSEEKKPQDIFDIPF